MRTNQQVRGSPSLLDGGEPKKPPPPPSSSSSATTAPTTGSAGRVVLAAVVHHDDNCCSASLGRRQQQRLDSIDHERRASKAKPPTDTHDKNNNNKDDGQPQTSNKLASKLTSRLKFTKNKRQAAQLIDSAQSNEYSQQHQHQHQQQRAARTKSDLEPPSEFVEQPTAADGNKMIEFKFDLIVEDQERRVHEQEENNSLASAKFDGLGQKKLDDNVLAIVESFVVDSNDACLMSVGRPNKRRPAPLNNGYHSGGSPEWPAHLFRLASRCVGQTFSLLAAIQMADIERQPSSLELSATLFLSAGDELEQLNLDDPLRSFEFVDLLAENNIYHDLKSNRDADQSSSGGNSSVDDSSSDSAAINWKATNCSSSTKQTSVDCLNSREASLILDRVELSAKAELERLAPASGADRSTRVLLMICLKLKRRINGGLFSNRMCLIDFDPKFGELRPILESTFNGHALAHLRRRRLHLTNNRNLNEAQSLVRASPSARAAAQTQAQAAAALNSFVSIDSQILLSSSSSRTTTTRTASSDDDAAARVKQQQAASESKLVQAEWLLYKQLSSALIRTLIIVHVHKLSPPASASASAAAAAATGSRQTMDDEYEHRLMADNLSLLEFARSIQRASAVKLKRRRKHLTRLHQLASSSQASLASKQPANETTKSGRRNELSLLSTPTRRPSATLSLAATSANDSRSQRGLERQRKCSMDTSLALARHFHFHRQRHSGADSRAMERLLRQTTGDLTESSSVSTSSGSAGYQTTNGSGPSSGNQTAAPNFSDSDSVASATLNSCSSSARFLPNDLCAVKRSRDRRQIELKWLAKQRQAKNGSDNSPPAVVRIDCCCDPASGQRSETTESTVCLAANSSETIADDLSDICSTVAEPPKQLRLEMFLQQLRPDSADPRRAPSVDEQQQVRNGDDDDDDDDCKSHSSIVDHLSSLAKELNCKLNYRLGQSPAATSCGKGELLPATQLEDLDLFVVTREQTANQQLARMGFLQQLLNSSSQLRQNNNNNKTNGCPPTPRVELKDSRSQQQQPGSALADQLAELSINCQPPAAAGSSSHSHSHSSDQSPSSSGAFTNSSNLSSSSATVSPGNHRRATAEETTSCGSAASCSKSDHREQTQISSSVRAALMRAQQQQQQNVKTSSC